MQLLAIIPCRTTVSQPGLGETSSRKRESDRLGQVEETETWVEPCWSCRSESLRLTACQLDLPEADAQNKQGYARAGYKQVLDELSSPQVLLEGVAEHAYHHIEG